MRAAEQHFTILLFAYEDSTHTCILRTISTTFRETLRAVPTFAVNYIVKQTTIRHY